MKEKPRGRPSVGSIGDAAPSFEGGLPEGRQSVDRLGASMDVLRCPVSVWNGPAHICASLLQFRDPNNDGQQTADAIGEGLARGALIASAVTAVAGQRLRENDDVAPGCLRREFAGHTASLAGRRWAF